MELVDSVQKIVQSLFPVMTFEKVVLMLMTGYVGYAIAYSGLPTKDRWAKILIFSLPYLVLNSICNMISGISFIVGFIIAVIISMILAGLWRKWGRSVLQWLLRRLRISNEDGYDSILNEMNGRTDVNIQTMLIHIKNGEILGTDLRFFQEQSFKNGTVDQYGNVRLYIMYKGTKKQKAGTSLEQVVPENHKDGYENTITVTVIPKEEIESIEYIVSKK